MKTLNIKEIQNLISNHWKEKYGRFLTEDNLTILSENLKFIIKNNKLFPLPLPHFKEELTSIALSEIKIDKLEFNEETLVNIIEKEKFKNILLLSGQRVTSASVQDESAIPPNQKTLLESCLSPFNNQITFAVKAWEKHVGRIENSFWGISKGNPKEKEKQVKKIIVHCLENKTWWNIFYHYKHKLVYEIRIANGQGIRWTQDGKKLIGFLEPFL